MQGNSTGHAADYSAEFGGFGLRAFGWLCPGGTDGRAARRGTRDGPLPGEGGVPGVPPRRDRISASLTRSPEKDAGRDDRDAPWGRIFSSLGGCASGSLGSDPSGGGLCFLSGAARLASSSGLRVCLCHLGGAGRGRAVQNFRTLLNSQLP